MTRAKLMEDRQLPIFIETRFFVNRFGKIVSIQPRTRNTRRYIVVFFDGKQETKAYKGAASRPFWIAHIFKSELECRKAQQKAEAARLIMCPHCNKAKLVKRPDRNGMYASGFVPQPYDCPECGREWTKDEDGNWHSHCATDREVFSADGKTLLERS